MPKVDELEMKTRVREILNRWPAVGLAVGVVRDGRLEFFVLGGNGAVYKRGQSVPNGNWTDWEGFGGSQLTDLAAGLLQDGRLEIFVTQ